MIKKIFFTVINILSFLTTFAQSKNNYVKDNTYYFEVTNSDIKGVGATILKESIKKSQFFILGEQHFSTQISKFTNAIIPFLSYENYKYFTAEIGPNSATKIYDLIKENKSLYNFNTHINNLVGEVPIPFFDGKEDEIFLKTAITKGFKIWGIDQEYLTSQVFLIDDIYRLSNNKTSLYPYYQKAKNYLIIETKEKIKNTKYPLFTNLLNSVIVNDFFKHTALTNISVQKIIFDLKSSWNVYQLRETKDYYSSLHKRLEIMQHNFINYYNKATKIDTLPKVVIKIGGNHASKGKTHSNIFDIGNFIMELANFNKQQSTTALIIPSAIIGNNGSQTNNIDKDDEPFIRPLLNDAKGKWILIDLKSIERFSWKNKIIYKSLIDYMYRFDYFIITPPSKLTTPNYKK